MILSICIPNYNRPDKLERLLKSIDSNNTEDVEIVISDDHSPKANEIKIVVDKFKQNCPYKLIYSENEKNLGYDKNLKAGALKASGDWILYMGNDDLFVPGAIDKLIQFTESNNDLGYILRSHYFTDKNNKTETFYYYNDTKFFEPGVSSYVQMFRKSVFISGFTIKREYILPLLKDDFDGTLLFQLYLVAEVCLKYRSAYFNEPLTQRYDEGSPEFGNAPSEKGLYTPGSVTLDHQLNFMRGYFKITKYLDEKYKINSTPLVKADMSKYLYHGLATQRDKGISVFLKYVKGLNSIGYNCTMYYYIYVFLLIILGKKICDSGIRIIKKILGSTPRL